MITYTDQALLDHLNWIDTQDIYDNAALIHKAKTIVLDTLGCVYAAFHTHEIQSLESTLATYDPGNFQIQQGARVSMNSAILLFASAACWHEACEGNAISHGRPAIATLAGMFPWIKNMTLKEMLRNFVKGYEISTKFAEMLRIKPGMHVDGNWPALGAAVAVGGCLNFNNLQIIDSINIAASQIPMSLYLPITQGANSRNSFLGHAAQLGTQSALAVKAGITAPKEAVKEYAKIVLSMPEPLWNENRVMNISSSYIKPFAAVRHVHYGALAALELRDRIEIEKIEKIHLKIYQEATIYCSNRAPKTPIQAQFSLSYGIAYTLVKGEIDFNAYDEKTLSDPIICQLERCVEIMIDEDLTQQSKRGATLKIYASNNVHSLTLSSALGDTESPMTQEHIVNKFTRYARSKLGEVKALELSHAIMQGDLNSVCPNF